MKEMKKQEDGRKKEENNKSLGQGDTFYKAVPASVVAPKHLDLPKIKVKTADILESIVIFFAGTVLTLIMLRIVLMALGIDGGNLLTYLLYATSYPFVAIFGVSQGQIPEMTSAFLSENIIIALVYFLVFYGGLKIIRSLKDEVLK